MTHTTEINKPKLGTVLVVDDQADVREALRLMLKSAGYAIQMADSPDRAITAAAACDPDLILVDMNYACDTTSGQEGLALLDRLRALRPNVPVIAMTGWSTIELAVQAMQHGACDFITKPWDVSHLLELFEKHVGSDHFQTSNGSAPSADLAIARRIQRRLLPPQAFAAAGLQFHCAFLPFGEVGGDLYDFFEIEPGRVGFLLGDVCGKGLGAALLVATLQATIRSQLELARNVSALLTRVNQQFFEATRPEHFASLFFGVYEANTRRIRYVNCGHPSPVLLRADESFEDLKPNATILGAFEKSRFEEQAIDFEPGSRLVLFSDGFSEAGVSDDDEDWTLDAIQTLASKHDDTLAGALAAAAVSRDQQTDDITVIEISHLPADAAL